MHWKETVINSKSIKWKKVKLENVEDGKLDFTLNLPFTSLFEYQAKKAFAQGMMTMMQFHVQAQTENKLIKIDDIINLFNNCGLPEVAEQFKDKGIAKLL